MLWMKHSKMKNHRLHVLHVLHSPLSSITTEDCPQGNSKLPLMGSSRKPVDTHSPQGNSQLVMRFSKFIKPVGIHSPVGKSLNHFFSKPTGI